MPSPFANRLKAALLQEIIDAERRVGPGYSTMAFDKLEAVVGFAAIVLYDLAPDHDQGLVDLFEEYVVQLRELVMHYRDDPNDE